MKRTERRKRFLAAAPLWRLILFAALIFFLCLDTQTASAATADKEPAASAESGSAAGEADSGDAAGTSNGEEEYEAVDGGKITEERLLDHTVEYEELGSLIHAFNLSVREMTISSENQKDDYREMLDTLRAEKAAASRDKEDAEDDGDMDAYAENDALEEVYSSAMASYTRTLKRLSGNSANKSRKNLEKQLTNGAQSLMISYESVRKNREYLEKLLELQTELYEVKKLQAEAGLSTELEVQTARNSCLGAEASLSSLTDTEESLYRSLCILLGQETDGGVSIAGIEPFTESHLEEMDLEKDTEDALMYNLELVELKLTSGGDSDGIAQKNRNIREQTDWVTRKMESLYEDVWLARDARDAAATGYEGAKLVWENAKTRYELGMLSRAEYLEAELSCLQKETSLETAELNLLLAFEAYDWAKKGIMDASQEK